MSAAEGLKALFERPVGSHADYLRAANELADALPLMLAVVEAAEAVRRSEGLEGREAEFVGSEFPTHRLAVALAALDEKLASDR